MSVRKRIPSFLILVALFTLLISPVRAQDAFDSRYAFDGTLEDATSDWDLSFEGTPSWESRGDGHALALIGKTWAEVPQGQGQAILTDDSYYLSVEFNMVEEGIDESARVLFGNKTWSYDDPGFAFQLLNEKSAWQPAGMAYVNYNIGGGTTEIAGRFYGVTMGEWHTAWIHVDFASETVTFGLDGRSVSQSLRENINGGVFDPEPFYASLAENPVRFGAPQDDWTGDVTWEMFGTTTSDHVAKVMLDNLRIASPRPSGEPAIVNVDLAELTAHLSGAVPLDADRLEVLAAEVKANLSGLAFADVEPAVRSFVGAHNTHRGALYEPVDWGMRAYTDFDPESRTFVDVGLWMVREGLTTANAALAEGITFDDHAGFPGPVNAQAARVQGGSAMVNTSYVKDPYYNLGQQQRNEANELTSYVYRPTGFYAPAGEAVTITVPQALVDTGVHIRVGGHTMDHTIFPSTNRFPVLKVDYRVADVSFDVINPLGGGIYVLVPLDVDLGWVDIGVDGAVRSPYFSTLSANATDMVDWPAIRQRGAPLADFESEGYLFTVQSEDIIDLDDPRIVLDAWDEAIHIVHLLHGRPEPRSRGEAFMFDTRTSVEGSFPGGYPTTPGLWSERDGDVKSGSFSPFGLINQGIWEQDGGLSALFHEMSHHQIGYCLAGEIETWVNLPFAAVLNQVHDMPLDEAFRWSTYQAFDRTDAAIDWMVTANFRNGDPIGWDPTTDFEPAELPYQARGSAKYVDMADIFGGWEAVGKVSRTFYDEAVAAGISVTYATQVEVDRDRYLENASDVLGCNLASLFHFWGIQPSGETAADLASRPACAGADRRILTYLRAAPRTNEDIRAFHAAKTAVHENQLKYQVWDPLLETFGDEEGQAIRTVGTSLLQTYFGIEAGEAPSPAVPMVRDFTVGQQPSVAVTFSWTASVDPDSPDLDYTWRLKEAVTGVTLVSRSRVKDTSVTIPASELLDALGGVSAPGQTVSLTQEVVTSDAFSVVVGPAVGSSWVDGVASNRDVVSLPDRTQLQPVFPNPARDGATVAWKQARSGAVTLVVTDVLGRTVSTALEGEWRAAGAQQLRIDTGDWAAGTYLFRLVVGGESLSRLLTVIQ